MSTYLPPQDLVGFPTMPHFVVTYRNLGNVAVTFSDFELRWPRLDGAIDANGEFRLTTGAELYIDKRLTSTIGGVQEYSKLDYRTDKRHLEPGERHTDFFDLGALLGWQDGASAVEPKHPLRWEQRTVPGDFHPVLTFSDSFGNDYYCDEVGVHFGEYTYPYAEAAVRALSAKRTPRLLTVSRGRFPGRRTWRAFQKQSIGTQV